MSNLIYWAIPHSNWNPEFHSGISLPEHVPVGAVLLTEPVSDDWIWVEGEDKPRGPNELELLEIARTSKLATIDRLRVNHESAGFAFDGKIFDSDNNSRERLINAVAAAHTALIGGGVFATEWVCQDNTTYSVPDAQTMLAIQLAFTYHGQACHDHTQVLKSAVRGAETLEALQAIDITTGWPG